MRGTYFVYARLIYLKNLNNFTLKEYMDKWEISESTAKRDIKHLRDFEDIEFEYDKFMKRYRRIR